MVPEALPRPRPRAFGTGIVGGGRSGSRRRRAVRSARAVARPAASAERDRVKGAWRLWDEWRTELLLVAAWGASRAVVYGFGVRFDKRELASSVQNIDPELLRHSLAESLWWLHGQPPGYNLFLGLVLKASGSHWALAFQAVHLLL